MLRRLLIALMLCLPAAALAGPVPYSGQLLENGTPVNGTRTLTLAIYDVASGGTDLYSDSQTLQVTDGVYHTMINAPDAIWDGSDRWVGVSVDGGPELTPRVKVGWVPYAVRTAQLGTRFDEHPTTDRTVTSNVWTKIDSVTITTPVAGVAIVSHAGRATWTGSVSVPLILFDISRLSPTSPATGVLPTQTGTQAPVNFTVMVPVGEGSTTIYLWSRIATTGQSYSVNSARFQALFIPE